uniref:Nucleolar RNA-associated protein n=1 Tax=Cucumis melo subsp. melo TaxID=412675 RepID=E5GCN3_CUCME|nr:nucleolar RNA-associated protein [Cucumis melo subsp. melo]
MDSDTLLDPMEMKVKELLKEFQLDYSPALHKHVEGTVSAIKKAIKLIPDDLKVTAAAAPGFIRDIGADKVEFKFRKPKSIKIGGSYAFQGIAKPDVNVDLLVSLPKECFHEKDYLNYRYHAKRFLYLCTIKKYLDSSSMFSKVEYSTLQNEARKPVLIVHPGKPEGCSQPSLEELKVAPGFFVRIIPTIAASYFSISKLNLKRNNIHALNQGSLLPATPKYNSSILEDMYFDDTAEMVRKPFLESKSLVETLILLKEKKQYKDLFPVVICNPSSNFNIAFRISQSGFAELQDEAAMALACLEKCSNGGFEEVFMTKIDFAVRYDHCIRLNLRGQDKLYASGFCMDDECWRLYEQKVHGVLSQGLTDRAKFIRVSWRNTEPGCNIENGLSAFDMHPLLVGISISSVEKAFRVVDIGPNADDKEDALKFRRFWGEKAELRRFKDGRIAESTDPITFSGTLLAAYEVLSKRLRSVEDIPLKVSAVQPLDSAFRYTSVYPPEPHPLAEEKASDLRTPKTFAPSCIKPLELEGSGNWPTDEVAIEKTKTAFLLKIGERGGIVVFLSHLNVNKLTKFAAGNDLANRTSLIDKQLFIQSQHSSMISGLQARHSIYGPVVSMLGRGSSRTVGSINFPEASTLPCSTFSNHRFLRLLSEYDWTFSPLVIDINNDLGANEEKEIADKFNMTRKDLQENPQNAIPAMFLATAYDKASEAWTKFSPKVSELKRLAAYARSSADLLTRLILQHQVDSCLWESLFRTPLTNYDAVILLHRDKLPYPQRLLFPSELNQGTHVAKGNPSKIFTPFLSPRNLKASSGNIKDRLLKEFSNTFNLWYDSLGGDAIGVTWGQRSSKKRGRDDEAVAEEKEPAEVLKSAGETGKGLMRSVYLLKAPRLTT